MAYQLKLNCYLKRIQNKKALVKRAYITLKVGPLKELTRQARKYYSGEIKSIKKKYDKKSLQNFYLSQK